MDKKRIWFFGDSYMSFNLNWVSELAKTLNCEPVIKAYPGSSILFTYTQLLENLEFISEDDRVVIGVTSPNRYYFRDNLHIIPGREDLPDPANKFQKQMTVFKDMIKYLEDSNLKKLNDIALTSVILTQILPEIKSRKKIAFATIDANQFNNYKYIPDTFKEYPSMFVTARNYITEYSKDTTPDELNRILYKPNHWIEDDSEYEKYFWKTYKNLFAKLH